MPLWQRVLWRLVWFVGMALCIVAFRLRATGQRRIPRSGGVLLLPNHTSFFDPLWVTMPVWRPVRFMASAHLFRLKGLAPVLRAMGAFPKKKFVSDRQAVVSLMRFVRGGAVVLVFPEGSRNFDGHTLPLQPGLGSLVRAAKVPVMYARVITGHHVQPRWARYPRFVPVRVEYDGPHDYAGVDPAEIEADAVRRISVDGTLPPPAGSFGWRMAHGLPDFLWACPHCLALGGLVVDPDDGNAVGCGDCGAGWTVDVGQGLTPRPGVPEGVSATTVHDAYHHICRAHRDADGRPTSGSTPGVYLRGEAELHQIEDDGTMVTLSTGEARVLEDVLEMGEQRLSLESLVAVSMEAGGRLQFRSDGQLYEIRATHPSALAWHYFLTGRAPPS